MDAAGKWIERSGKLKPEEIEEIDERLRYLLGLSQDPSDDWFVKNATPQLLEKVYRDIKPEERENALCGLMDVKFEDD